MTLRASITTRPQGVDPFRFSPRTLPGLMLFIDNICIFSAAVFAFLFDGYQASNPYSFTIFSIVFILLSYTIFFKIFHLSSLPKLIRPISRLDDIIVSIVTSFLFLLTIIFSLQRGDSFSLQYILYFCVFSCLSVSISRLIAQQFILYLRHRGLMGRNMAIVGDGPQAEHFLEKLSATDPIFTKIVGIFKIEENQDIPFDVEKIYKVEDIDTLINKYIRKNIVDEVVVAMPWSANKKVLHTIERLKELPINVYLSTDLVGFDLSFKPVVGTWFDIPMFEVVQKPISGWSGFLKRIEDIVVSTTALLIVLPLFVVVSILIKLDSKGPIIFKQRRLGFNNEEFTIYKFRSMYLHESGEKHIRQARRGDPRITRVGRFLRSSSIDELPQLLNVLEGKMSIVGPRPHAISHNEEYGSQIRGYFARHKVKPGITGWAQVNGLRGETDTIEKMNQRIRYDVYYADNWSIIFDIKIIILTVVRVLFQKTAY